MSNYRMTLIVGGREINIPVLPAKLNVSSPGKNERVTVLDLGEVLLYVKRAFGFCPGKVSFRPIPRRTLPDKFGTLFLLFRQSRKPGTAKRRSAS